MAEEHVDHGNMTRDDRDLWPDGAPVGTFDIEQSKIEGYPEATGHAIFVCPNGQRCAVLLGAEAVGKSEGRRLAIWKWDGNLDRPTLTPSINCQPPGCGWHGFITAGRIG